MKKIVFGILLLGVVVAIWYLFIRPFEFAVKFQARTLPGDIIQTVRIWDRALKNAEILEVDSVYSLKQRITWGDHQYICDWKFKVVDDSISKVRIEITEPGKELQNKLFVPFSHPQIERDAEEIARTFFDILKEHLKITRVKVVGERETAPVFCVCSTLETRQIEKANGMMKDYDMLTSFIADHQLIVQGPPIVKVREWNHSKDRLKYDFCFPIVKTDLLPKETLVNYQEFRREKVLHAVYNGNYITSDRAWYELIDYAQKHKYEVNGLPIEFFHNNPNLGINEETWRADIYLPIK